MLNVIQSKPQVTNKILQIVLRIYGKLLEAIS